MNSKDNFSFDKIILKNFINLTLDEKKTVLEWRNHNNVKKMMFTNDEISFDNHLTFIDSLKKSSSKLYFLVEYKSKQIGVVDFYDIKEQTCYWGFYLNPDFLSSSFGVLLEYYVLEYAFNVLCIETLYCESLKENNTALRLHAEFGFSNKNIDDSTILSKINKQEWSNVKSNILPLIQMF